MKRMGINIRVPNKMMIISQASKLNKIQILKLTYGVWQRALVRFPGRAEMLNMFPLFIDHTQM